MAAKPEPPAVAIALMPPCRMKAGITDTLKPLAAKMVIIGAMMELTIIMVAILEKTCVRNVETSAKNRITSAKGMLDTASVRINSSQSLIPAASEATAPAATVTSA